MNGRQGENCSILSTCWYCNIRPSISWSDFELIVFPWLFLSMELPPKANFRLSLYIYIYIYILVCNCKVQLLVQVNNTLQGTNISRFQCTFEDDFAFLQVGYVNSLEGNPVVFFTSQPTTAFFVFFLTPLDRSWISRVVHPS